MERLAGNVIAGQGEGGRVRPPPCGVRSWQGGGPRETSGATSPGARDTLPGAPCRGGVVRGRPQTHERRTPGWTTPTPRPADTSPPASLPLEPGNTAFKAKASTSCRRTGCGSWESRIPRTPDPTSLPRDGEQIAGDSLLSVFADGSNSHSSAYYSNISAIDLPVIATSFKIPDYVRSSASCCRVAQTRVQSGHHSFSGWLNGRFVLSGGHSKSATRRVCDQG